MNEIVRPKRFGDEDVLRLASHLTERDRWIAKDCFEFRVLTSSQIKRLHFTGMRTAAARLDVLYRLRVLDRFRPSLPMGEGTAPYHWILDEAGALIVADHLNIERAKLGWQHSIAAGVATSQKLAHHVEVNEFFTRLAVEANASGGALSEWYGERTCHHLFAGVVVADGYGVLNLPGRAPMCFLVELDRGTEPTGRLRKKAEDYELHLHRSALRRLDPFVLVLVPSAFENGDLDPARFKERLSALDTRLDALQAQDQALARELDAGTPTAPDTAALHAVADQLAHVIATGDPDQTKALLRILIAELQVNSRVEILPTYRVGAPVVCAQTSSVGPAGLEPATYRL